MIRFYLTLAKNICKHNPIRTFISVLLVILAFTVYNIQNSTYFGIGDESNLILIYFITNQ
jgi:hypothetical protein